MFPGYLVPNPRATPGNEEIAALIPSTTQEIVDTELEAHGLSIVEIQKGADGTWQVILDSQFNRRITATTPLVRTGPAAGADLLKTSAAPTGAAVIGTLNNRAGGSTPWGTVISGEGSTYEEPVSSWPDGTGAPRPTVVVIRKLDGGAIGG